MIKYLGPPPDELGPAPDEGGSPIGPPPDELESSMDIGVGTTRPMVAVTPEQRLAEKLGFQYPRLQQSPTYKPGELQQTFEQSKGLQSTVPGLKQIQEVTHGATAPERKLEQLYYYLKNKAGISQDPQYEYEKAKLAASEAGYQAPGRTNLPVVGNPMELAGAMGGMPNPSLGNLGSLKTLAGLKASAPVLGKTAALGAGTAAAQPVENVPEQNFLQQTGQQALAGGIGAPIAQIGAEKIIAPATAKLMKLLGGKPKVDVRTLQKDLTKAGEDQGDIVQSELQRMYDEDRRIWGKPFQELRAIKGVEKPPPDVELHGNQTSYKGRRFSNLLGPEDEVIVAKTPKGEEAGYLWLTKEKDGFTIRKVEVDPKFQRKGIASYMNQEAENAFGPYKGATDYTPEGKALRASINAKKQTELVPLEGYKTSLDEAMEEASTSGARLDPKAMTILKGYKEGIAKSKTTDWNRALNISKKLNEDIADAYNGPEPNRELGRQLEKVKRSLDADLDEVGAQFGDRYKKAKAGWAENVGKKWEDPTEGGRILYKARTSPVPDETIAALVKTKSADRASIYYNRLSPKGQNAVKSYTLDNLMEDSKGANGKFDPMEFTRLYKEKQKVIDVFFHGDDKTRLEGLHKLMQYATKAGSLSGAGVGMLATTPLMGTSPVMKLSPAGGAWAGNRWLAAPFRSGFAKMFQTAPMQKLLLEAANLPADSPKLNALLLQIPKMTGIKEGQSDNEKIKTLLGGQE